jgi:4-oxalocrotonate tautomerase
MPIITIQVTGNPVTPDQKRALINESTEMMERVLDKPKDKTWVLIDEVPLGNWGVAGAPVTRDPADSRST